MTGALKRQAARFRIYGYNAGGKVVGELTPDNADIRWTVHLANKKAQWYEFQAALDIPEAATLSVPRRNPAIHGASRQTLAIDPGPRSIAGISVTDHAGHVFDTGTFKGTPVTLGELQTDDRGRLLVLGGLGKSASPSGAPVYDPANPNSFNNAADWYDDISDGPVTAEVSIDGRKLPVEAAWVAVAPPNYAPDIIGWRPMYDLLIDVYVQCGWLPMPATVSFKDDILPVLRRLSGLQWVNKGFATMFGRGCPMDFENPEFIAKLGRKPDPVTKSDPYAELRQVIFNSFRPSFPKVDEPPLWPHPWPWIYGDSYGSFATDAPDNYLHLPSVKEVMLRRWVAGDFIDDWTPAPAQARTTLESFPLNERPAMLDRAALTYCLADAFHPGCEMTWPMRHASMYDKPFRIRHRPAGQPEPDYGNNLDQQTALQPGGPLYAQGPGDITRWMAVPWQGDSAFCRSGYDTAYDPYVPTFWPARVPNQVLTEEDYQTVINTALPREQRIAAFNHRPDWERAILKGSVAEVMAKMIAHFGAMGIVEQRPGVKGDPDFPEIMFVESVDREQTSDRSGPDQQRTGASGAAAQQNGTRRLGKRRAIGGIPERADPAAAAMIHDVLVAGAGPAGAVAATLLARKGYRVVLADGVDPARHKIGEHLAAGAVHLLRRLRIDFHPERHVPNAGTLSCWGSEQLIATDSFNDPEGSGLLLDRTAFDAALRANAIAAGAQFRPARRRFGQARRQLAGGIARRLGRIHPLAGRCYRPPRVAGAPTGHRAQPRRANGRGVPDRPKRSPTAGPHHDRGHAQRMVVCGAPPGRQAHRRLSSRDRRRRSLRKAAGRVGTGIERNDPHQNPFSARDLHDTAGTDRGRRRLPGTVRGRRLARLRRRRAFVRSDLGIRHVCRCSPKRARKRLHCAMRSEAERRRCLTIAAASGNSAGYIPGAIVRFI